MKTDKIQDRLSALETEREGLQAAVISLDTEALDHQTEVTRLQALAARTSEPGALDAAEQAENRAVELQRQSERKRAALAAVETDLQDTRQALEKAEREEQEARLKAIKAEAAKIAESMKPEDTQSWFKLQILYDEMIALVQALVGLNSIGQLNAHPCRWTSPAAALQGYYRGIHWRVFEQQRRPFSNEREREMWEVAHLEKWIDPPSTLREAFGL